MPIQKRSKQKNGLLAATGGHAKSGETSIQAIQTEVPWRGKRGHEMGRNWYVYVALQPIQRLEEVYISKHRQHQAWDAGAILLKLRRERKQENRN